MDIERLGLVGVFLGGALPWLEAVFAIPAGILLGLPPLAVVGNLSTVALAVSLGASGRRAFVWVGAATVGWSVVAALLVVWGVWGVGAAGVAGVAGA